MAKKAARQKPRRADRTPRRPTRYWAGRITRESDALDLDEVCSA
jgi:hypothetical protein